MARIIIAEDDEIVGEIACEALIAGGHAAGVLPDGRDALNAIRARQPDLVILDCNMPGLSGLLVLRELRNSIEFCELPVLLLTGRTSGKDVDLGYYEGADDYMTKPFDPAELLFRVDELLAKKAKTSPTPHRRQAGFGQYRPS
ncbi:response regulator transcription factor [Sphingomonas radiodurans]|uniref:response regulator transcription factor n=1 Tax=Sphingomonas radiodurans TaxID=2890321 RepID=UPI001E4D114F|nr:response regulator transcription factor [Sphingomonas radiodurans]WBH15327.1 response regulator transcription factor [Sphingomonas radiodurans]